MVNDAAPVALLYDDSAYREATDRAGGSAAGAPAGLMGRQVAGREFLDAFLTHGTLQDWAALVYSASAADSLVRFCKQHPSAATRRRPRVVPMDAFLEHFGARPAARQLYTPCPPDPGFAWARRHAGPGAFALSGVTHTLCTAGAARVLCEMVTAPYEPYDALICTSSAVVAMVRALTGAYADHLRDQFGGALAFRPRLELIPLGVNPDRFRPALPRERAARRAALRVADDALAVLFVGRFTPHAKAHPFPLFHAAARAAHETGKKVHLVLSGWAPSEPMLRTFLDAARAFAPGVPVSVVDGMDPDLRFGVWQCADVFASFSDSIQETFGLAVVEAMACGLPVVASDWDGYRDLVADGETGILAPTCAVGGATADAAMRLLLGGVDYDGFLAECNQAVAVDPEAATRAFVRLLSDAELRRRMGEAGRRRVLERFTWAGVVRAYEALWRDQEKKRRDCAAREPPSRSGPACFPSPEISFAGYPTRVLGDADRLEAAPGAEAGLELALTLPLTSYASARRVADAAVLRTLLAEARAPRTVAELDAVLGGLGVGFGAGRATLAWLLKYGLLRQA